MKTFNVQYSVPAGDRIAASDWREYNKKIKATSDKEAIAKFNQKRDGTWMILDCWEV